MKYHLNPETGTVGRCSAKRRCRFGDDSNHYPTEQLAREALEEALSAKYGVANSHTRADFTTVKVTMAKALEDHALVDFAEKLKPVANEEEMIQEWFDGDRNRFAVLSYMVYNEELKQETKNAVGKLVGKGFAVSLHSGDFSQAPSADTSSIDLIGDFEIDDPLLTTYRSQRGS